MDPNALPSMNTSPDPSHEAHLRMHEAAMKRLNGGVDLSVAERVLKQSYAAQFQEWMSREVDTLREQIRRDRLYRTLADDWQQNGAPPSEEDWNFVTRPMRWELGAEAQPVPYPTPIMAPSAEMPPLNRPNGYGHPWRGLKTVTTGNHQHPKPLTEQDLVDMMQKIRASPAPQVFTPNATSSGLTEDSLNALAAATAVVTHSKHPSRRSTDPLRYWTQMRETESPTDQPPTSTASPDERP